MHSGASTAPAFLTGVQIRLSVPSLGITCCPWNSGEHLVPRKAAVCSSAPRPSPGLWVVWGTAIVVCIQICLCVISPWSFLFTDGIAEARVLSLVQAKVCTHQARLHLELGSPLLRPVLCPTDTQVYPWLRFKVSASCYMFPG